MQLEDVPETDWADGHTAQMKIKSTDLSMQQRHSSCGDDEATAGYIYIYLYIYIYIYCKSEKQITGPKP